MGEGGGGVLCLITLNCASNALLLGGLANLIKIQKPDLVFCQEIVVNEEKLNTIVNPLGYNAKVGMMEYGNLGLATVYRSELETDLEILNVGNGRVQEVHFRNEVFFNIYGPSGTSAKLERREFYGECLFNIIRGEMRPILGGDWNCVCNEADVEANYNNKKCIELGQLLREKGLVDASEMMKQPTPCFTFQRPGTGSARLDRWYIPKERSQELISIQNIVTLSDHKAVEIKIKMEGYERQKSRFSGMAYWKLNSKLLEEQQLEDQMCEIMKILEEEKGKYEDIAVWWEKLVKPTIKDTLIKYSRYRAKSRADTVKALFMCLDDERNENNWDKAELIKERLKTMLLEDNMGIIVRSKMGADVEEERSSLFHLNREHKRGNRNNVLKLKIKREDGNEEIEENGTKIEENVLKFFEPLFRGMHSSDLKVNNETFQQDSNYLHEFLEGLSKLTEEEKEYLLRPVDLEELKEIVKELENGKSPGSDGFTYELYKKWGHLLCKHLVDVINCILEKEQLNESMEEALARLIPKVDGTPTVQELRPISLLQTDYKIMTAILAKRLIKVLPIVLKSGQLCSIEGKNISEGMTNMIAKINYVEKEI